MDMRGQFIHILELNWENEFSAKEFSIPLEWIKINQMKKASFRYPYKILTFDLAKSRNQIGVYFI